MSYFGTRVWTSVSTFAFIGVLLSYLHAPLLLAVVAGMSNGAFLTAWCMDAWRGRGPS